MPKLQHPPIPGSSAPATADSLVSQQTASIPAIAPDYEWIYPNSADGKYFTATQAQVFIGNLFIDELVSLQFAFQGNHIPVFGYASEEADAFGGGRRLVQGQLALNFVTEGYLFTALQEYAKLFNQTPLDGNPSSDQIAALVKKSQQPGLTQEQQNAISDQILKLAAQGGPNAVAQAKSVLVQQPAVNAIALKVPFDIVCMLQGAGRVVQRTLSKCVLTSNEQVFAQDGCTVLDVYGFMGRSAN